MTVAIERLETSDGVERRRLSAGWLVLVLIAVLPPLTQFAYLAVKGRSSWPMPFTDDAFYYFGVAHNIAGGEGSTFSGQIETNGYHPAWLLGLTAVAAVVRDRLDFLAAVMVVQAVLWIGVVQQAVRIGRRLGSELFAVAGLAALGVLAVLTGQLSFGGMESAPLLLVLLVAVRLIVDEAKERDEGSYELRLGLVLALAFLVRLDSALTVVPLAAVSALRGGWTSRGLIPRATRLVGPSLVVGVVYVAVNHVLFGTFTPVSGQAKALGGPHFNLEPIRQALEAGQVGHRPLWFGAVTLVMFAAAWRSMVWRSDASARRLMQCGVALLAGQLLLLGYLTFATSYAVWAWYHYNLALISFCSAVVLAKWLVERAGAVARTGLLMAGTAFAFIQVPVTLTSGATHSSAATDTAEFIRRELPPDAVLAMGDRAGLVGYLSDRPLLQTEGLMADAEWLHNLEDGTALERMNEEGVDYYLWSGSVPSPRVQLDGRSCHTLLEPRAGEGPKFPVTVCDEDRLFYVNSGKHEFTVWRYRQSLNDPLNR